MKRKMFNTKNNDHVLSFISVLIVVALTYFLSSCNSNKDNKSPLNIGLAEVSYNPPVGSDLVGNYRGSDYASRGVHDSLYARAMVVENEKKEKVAFLSVDICKLPRESINMMRSYIAANTGIKPGNIMIHATHTHSGPKSELDAPKAQEYLSRAASAVINADKRLMSGRIFVGRVQESNVSFNRRLRCIDGATHMSWEKLEPDFVSEPLGPVDPELIALTIEQEGLITGAAINFGCHAATLTGNNWLYSADFPGFMAGMLKKTKGKEFIPLFFNGCCGNVTQVNYEVGFIDTYDECKRIGNVLGAASIRAIGKKNIVKGNEISVSKEMVPLKRMTITEEQFKWSKKIMEEIKKNGMPPLQPDGIPDAQFATQWIEMYNTQHMIDSLEVMVVRIGDVALVGLPGEMFCEFGMDIKTRSPFKNTIVMGLTNDSRKYFPTKVSFTQGPKGYTPMITGYETTPGATLYDIGSGEKLVESAIRQLEILHKN